jgi:arylsulfatase A-like enzyme
MSRSPLALTLLLGAIACSPAGELESYGQPLSSSPIIATLAAEGVLFSDAITSAPSTLPSHSTILTGLHPFAHGARSNSGYVLSQQNVTLAEALQTAGYRTGAEIAAPVIAARTHLDQGFDLYRDPFTSRSVVDRLDYERAAELFGSLWTWNPNSSPILTGLTRALSHLAATTS